MAQKKYQYQSPPESRAEGTAKSKRRFKTEREILDAIDECHQKAEAYTREANECENDADELAMRAHEIEQENIALAAFDPLPSPMKAILKACELWRIGEPQLATYLHVLGCNQDKEPLASVHRDTLAWACREWPRILTLHVARLRQLAFEKKKLAKRRRAGADNQISGRAAELGKLLAIMRTEAMPFLPSTNKAHDTSIPASL